MVYFDPYAEKACFIAPLSQMAELGFRDIKLLSVKVSQARVNQ